MTVRIIDGSQSMTMNWTIEVDGLAQARFLASKLFGARNVISVTEVRNEFIESTETISADQLKVKSIQDQQKRFSELAKREKARQSLLKAQKKMQNAFSTATN